MRFIVFMMGNEDSEGGVMPTTEQLAEMDRFKDELIEAGVMLGGEGLAPTSDGVTVNFLADGARSVVDGPFTEAKEVVAGFWLWQCDSLEDAVEWAKRMPDWEGEGSVQIRRIFEAEDFGDVVTPEMIEEDARQRAQIRANVEAAAL
ncbi:MAG: hypothetical protein QOG62_2150 [Thermoleophilaceae bacterium]|jgi:hypothetical protein|nr:hypothetical protein [Thermoleophilaceae bacterium]